MGGAYAVIALAAEAASLRLGRQVDPHDWRHAQVAATAARITFACATAGNHGRSVARGAQQVGARCVVFVPAGLDAARTQAIARHGARIVRVPRGYDRAVAEAARTARAQGWTLVSDTSWPGYERVPRLVMQGYVALIAEAMDAVARPPTHVFVQAGVGGLAAAISAYLSEVHGPARPFLTVVEPDRAACLFESARAGSWTRLADDRPPTRMTMLDCQAPSRIAWRILSRTADAFMTVDEAAASEAVDRLSRPARGDPPLAAGESGAAGLAGLLRLAGDAQARAAIGLGADARVLLINTEGPAAPAEAAVADAAQAQP